MTDCRMTARCFLLIFTATILLCQSSPADDARLIDKIVAIVNGEVITQTELDSACRVDFAKLRQSTPATELDEAMTAVRDEILDALIDTILMGQKAKELGIEVSEQEIDDTIGRIMMNNGMNEEEFYEELHKTGVGKEEYRRQLSSRILRSRLVSYEVRSRVVISEEEARKYYDDVYTKRKIAKGYHLLQIGLTWGAEESASPSRDKALLKTEGIRKMVIEGQDFRELANSFSELPSAKYAGDLGFFTEEEMSESVRDAIANLKPGEVSEIIESGDSFQFFRLLAKNVNGATEFSPFAEVSQEIIDLLREEALDARYKTWLQEIKDQAIIKKLI